jgi:hypothetical protein
MRREAPLLALVRDKDLRQVELSDHVQDEVGEVIVRQPILR